MPLYRRWANRGGKISRERRWDVVCRFEIAIQCHCQMERDYSAQNARAKVSMSSNIHAKVHVFKFLQFLFSCFSHGCENRENLDLAKISRYIRYHLSHTIPSQLLHINTHVVSALLSTSS